LQLCHVNYEYDFGQYLGIGVLANQGILIET